ncbi:MAG: (2Fe-2S)-binding protein [Planctomycetota bacterium]|nr:(2Fe-2S)-binding protein [Planctomycetota bacterium]MDA1211024.1 (2Fe-2S)-binding protein [Planctomycetota bacterium]
MQLDDKVCYCFHISKRKIVNHLRIYQPKRVSQLSECGGAGTGCGWCIPFLKRYYEQWQQGDIVAADDISPDQYAKDRGHYIKAGKGTPPPGATPS